MTEIKELKSEVKLCRELGVDIEMSENRLISSDRSCVDCSTGRVI